MLTREIRDELSHKSNRSQSLLETVCTAIPKNVAPRSFEFWASTNDFAVSDLDSSLPTISQFERHHVLNGYGHKSVTGAVGKKQMEQTFGWMRAIKLLV